MSFLQLDPTTHRPLRAEIISTALKMNAAGINQGKSGNVSARLNAAGDFLITPTGVEYDRLRVENIVEVHADGSHVGSLLPSSEWRFHRDVYAARADVCGIVHTHSAYATSLAVHGRCIPAFHYMVAAAGGHDIPCAPYATFGTQALSDSVLAALRDRQACLMAHHGMIACGKDLARSIALAIEVETLAQMYWQALQIGEPPLLDRAEMDRVIDKFRTYGQQPGQADTT
jgi:L-fuculose-phosphate aldolase